MSHKHPDPIAEVSSTTTPTSPLPPHKSTFLTACLRSSTLTFGTYTLKSGRTSPYFFNIGTFHRGDLLTALSSAFAHTISTSPLPPFDVLFGPAYKGIPLAATTVPALAALDAERFGGVSYAFNRKERKTHGDGGGIVGAGLGGRRVVVIDDVITAGTAVREAAGIIREEGGELVGVVVALDRMERGGEGDRVSTIEGVRREFGVPVVAVLTLDDIVEGYRAIGTEEDIRRLEEYREKYKAAD